MQITRESDYAIRCTLYLVSHADRLATVGDISVNQDIPKAFTAKILQKLVKAGIAKSNKGIKGGFSLNKDPKTITLSNVIEAVQGPIALNICVIDKKACNRSKFCSIHPVWIEIQQELLKKLNSYTVESIANKQI
ncbi:MAG: Rrf2 family transcriptional regulator [Spirochaetota bacterium]|nr:Rrf2 family transcriptional regulator [Spirochaetota bacterium]